MEDHAKESIKHKVVLPNSKTINIEGTKFKYKVHYDQLNDKDLLMIEKYANHIFHAYQEKYGLDMNTDHTVKGFIYNSLTDLRNARPGHNTAYATATFHHYPHTSESIAHDLTQMIYFTLNLYNKENYGIPFPRGGFIKDVEKELKAIRLDDNQEESSTEERSKTTINQEESKNVEPSGPEEEKGKVEEEKSSQEKISPETVLPHLNNSDNNQEESNTAEKPETTINQEESKNVEPSGSEAISTETMLPNSKTINIEETNFKYEIHYDQLDDKDLLTIERYANHIFHAYQERYGLDMNTDHTVKGFIYNSLTDLRNARPGHNTAYAGASFHHYPHKSGSIAYYLTEIIDLTLNVYNKEKHGIPYPEDAYTFIRDVAEELKAIRLDDNQEEPKKIEPSGSEGEEKIKLDEEKSRQEEVSPETVLPDLNNLDNNQEESNTAEKTETTINQEESKDVEPSGSEAISTETILPNSKTINIEGTKFKYEIHYDQLDEKDLLTIEKYANHIFHAYQARYGLDINTDHTFRGFIYNNLADLRNAHPEYGTAHAGADFHHYPHESEFIAHDLTAMIDFTLNLYNEKNSCIPYPEDAYTFIRDVAEELEKIGLDDNQEESSTEERSKTTINQEKELEEQDVITTTDHPLDDYNHDYHLIG